MTDGADDSARKHVAAFLGAPIGTAVLAALVWLLLSEPCALGPVTVSCIPMGAAQLGLGEVAMIATVVAVLAAAAIEVAG